MEHGSRIILQHVVDDAVDKQAIDVLRVIVPDVVPSSNRLPDFRLFVLDEHVQVRKTGQGVLPLRAVVGLPRFENDNGFRVGAG